MYTWTNINIQQLITGTCYVPGSLLAAALLGFKEQQNTVFAFKGLLFLQ